MDIDEYLKQKKALEEQKKTLESKGKLPVEKVKVEKQAAQPTPQPASQPVQQPSQGGSSGMKTLMMINMVILIGVLAVVAVFYLFPPSIEGDLTGDNKLTGKVVLDEGEEDEDEKDDTTKDDTTKDDEDKKDEDEDEEEDTIYLGPEFDLTIEDSTEGFFREDGKLADNGRVLSIRGGTVYNDFSLTLQNLEADKIFCAIDRKIDVDTDIDGIFDIEGVYSLDRHGLKMKPAAEEVIKAGIESVPGAITNYQGKGEVWVEYEARCYFCLDSRCDAYEERGEAKEQSSFRVRINDHLLNQEGNETD